jgi:hypothetical protein
MNLKPIVRLVVIFFLLNGVTNAQDNLNVIQSWLKYSDATNSLYRHITGEAYQMLENRRTEVADIDALSDWQDRQKRIRETLMDIVGPFPEKTPLNARITRTVKKDGFRVEHIIFESQPGFYVTSSMYIPDGPARMKYPAVIYCSGHTPLGYRSNVYQNKITNLVKKGFVVFAFDPVGQGERLEYFDAEKGGSVVGGPTREHSYPGAQAFITGSSQARFMIWDGVRSVDYLLTRREVDPGRIGITGRSGGGTQSACIAAIDERIYAAAPEAYITNFTRLLQSIGPQDAEQNLFNGIMHGIDHADLLAVRAPKPALMVTTINDFFSIQGARETAKEVSRIYRSYGKAENFGMVEDLMGHGTTRKNREAMYAFFQEHLQNPGSPEDMEVELLTAEELQVTPTGQLSTHLKGETVFSLNRNDAARHFGNLAESRKNNSQNHEAIQESAMILSGYREPEKTVAPVYTGRVQRDGYLIDKYYIQGEGEYIIPYLLMVPDNPGPTSLIYLHPSGKSAAASDEGHAEWFVRKGYTVLIPDLIGTGETGPGQFRGDSEIEGISYNVWFASVLTGRSITGIRAGDVVRLSRVLRDHHELNQVYALAEGELAPVVLHAAAFESLISRVALLGSLSSYNSIVMSRFYATRFIQGAVPGMLKSYDLPDLAASLAPRGLLLVNTVDGAGTTDNDQAIDYSHSVIRDSYKQLKAAGSLIIRSGQDMEEYFTQWLGN